MLASRALLASAQALVHPSAAAEERDRHAIFISHMLGLAFAALGIATASLALRGAPHPAESLVFALTLVPAGAAVTVARTGRLELGELAASLGLVALALALGLMTGAGLAAAWLVAAVAEAAASLDRRVARLGLGSACAALLVILARTNVGTPIAAPSTSFVATLDALAVVVAALALHRLCGIVAAMRSQIAAQDARNEAIAAVQTGIVIGFDAGGSVRALTAPAGSVLDAPPAEVFGRAFFDHVHVADRPAFLKLVDDAARNAAPLGGTIRLRAFGDPNGEPRYHDLEMRARRVEGGDEIVAVVEDVSARAGRDHEIEAARRAVAQALRAKDQFLTTMSHELRTPLNSIIGFSDILASRTTRPDDVAKQCQYARTIHQSGQHLLGVVNSVLDMSRLQVGIYPITLEPFALSTMLVSSMEGAAAEAREAQVKLVRDWPDSLEEMVGDRRALRQATAALLSNAIKFTPARGTVTLAARAAGTGLVVTVTDTGVGISPEDLRRIGEPFVQACSGTGRAFEGTGLGLSLVRGLVGLHAGSLSIESEVGHGTAVSMRLPLDCRTLPRRGPDAAIEIVPPRRTAPRPPSRLKDAA